MKIFRDISDRTRMVLLILASCVGAGVAGCGAWAVFANRPAYTSPTQTLSNSVDAIGEAMTDETCTVILKPHFAKMRRDKAFRKSTMERIHRLCGDDFRESSFEWALDEDPRLLITPGAVNVLRRSLRLQPWTQKAIHSRWEQVKPEYEQAQKEKKRVAKGDN
jgi:hypothetical protein